MWLPNNPLMQRDGAGDSREEAIEYINDDELVEITPDALRLRKYFLDENERKRKRDHDWTRAE